MYVFERRGGGPVVVCVHGYCQSSAYWRPTVDLLAKTGDVHGLAPDLPGFGNSAGDPGPYTMEAYADRLLGLLDERDIERIVLVGGSMGGVVAQHFALRHPARLLRLLLVSTGGATADPDAALAKAKALAEADWNEAVVSPIVAGFFYKPPPAGDLAAFRKIALMAAKDAAIEAARSNARSRTIDRLGSIAVPTLIVQGRHDRARTPEHGADMRARLPNARLDVLEGAGHTPQLEEPDAFHKIVLPFLLEKP